ncbi:MAG: hydroxyacid dehydrogenase [Phycisphaerales bacterium]|nr:hydroxyacid dehydrogenase [Phycisphaerales bacterium]
MSQRPRILLAEALDPETHARISRQADVAIAPASDEAGLIAALEGVHGLVVRTHTPVTKAVIHAAKALRVIGVAGVGVERVDLAAARERGIAVLSTPTAASDAVAELAVALMLNLLRPIGRLSAAYAAGQFAEARREPHGVELGSCTVGILGLGNIGSRVARICAAGFQSRVIFHDIADVRPIGYSAERVSDERLWSESDILSIHVPLTTATRGLIGRSVLGRMRSGARLVNTARGALVDTAALIEALRNGQLAGAGLDVTDPEPLPPGHELFGIESCVLTPHVASRTHGGLARMHAVADAVLAHLLSDRERGV